MLLEVIVQSPDDAVEAVRGGADRLEIVRAIRQGGLTPPSSLVREIAAATTLPLRVMVRERDSYTLGPGDLPALRRAAEEFALAGADGLVAGFAAGGRPDLDALRRVVDGVPVAVTFHRAFDVLEDPLRGIDAIAAVACVDRILTSGGDGPAAERAARLAQFSARAADRLTVIAGGGVDREALAFFARTGCVREVHVGRAAREGGDPEGPVSASLVRELREVLERRSDGGSS
jgi:copper homeostasis protein